MSTSKTDILAGDLALAAGVEKHLLAMTLYVDSKKMTGVEVLARVRRRAALAQAVLDARAALATALLRSHEELDASDAFVKNLRQGVRAMFASSPDVLADFGLAAPRPMTPLTAAAQVLAVERRAATRAARHTMGPVQRAAIHGTLAGPLVVGLDGSVEVEAPEEAPGVGG